MKPIHLIAVLLSSLLLSTFSAYSTTTPKCTEQSLHEELHSLLRSPDLLVEKDSKVMIVLTANSEGEMIVLSVKTKDEGIDGYVKDRLNYKKLCNSLKPGELYYLPLKLKSR